MSSETKNGNVPENANEGCPGIESTKAGTSNSCKGCPMQQSCSSGTAAN